jgi:hypothetical protein
VYGKDRKINWAKKKRNELEVQKPQVLNNEYGSVPNSVSSLLISLFFYPGIPIEN